MTAITEAAVSPMFWQAVDAARTAYDDAMDNPLNNNAMASAIRAALRMLAVASAETPDAVQAAVAADQNLEMLIRDLRPFAERPVGSIRIDMEDVRSILALYDARSAAPLPTGSDAI